MGSAFVRLNGGGHIASYFGTVIPGKPYVASVRVRGKGEVWFGCYEYSEAGQTGGATFVARPVASDKWMEYRNIREGMAATGINWHQIQAWRRWDREFRTVFDGCKMFARKMQLGEIGLQIESVF